MVYFDNAATTKIDTPVIKSMNDYYMSNDFNPNSKHVLGLKSKEILEISREKVGRLINASGSDIIFNSGATEGINTILRGYSETNYNKGNHIITTKVEHQAVLKTCSYLEEIGFNITYLDVNDDGLIDLQELKDVINNKTLIVSILYVNNETGVIQDIEKISNIVKSTNAKLFIDGTQAVGKINIDVNKIDVDFMCFSAHKYHGPKGVGALFVKDIKNIKPLIWGGEQEYGLRAGTQNVPGIVGMAKASEIVNFDLNNIRKINEYLEKQLLTNFDCFIVGGNTKRSPYISNAIFKNIDADVVVKKLKNLCVSTGSACSNKLINPSHVLKAMKINNDDIFSSLRFSISKHNTKFEVDIAINELKRLLD